MPQSTSNNQDWHVSQGDHFKSMFDYLKHISTLATGSILLIATFLEKLFKQPLYSWCVGLAVGAFFISLVASMAAYSALVLNYPRIDRVISRNTLTTIEKVAVGGGIITTWASFLVGVGAIGFFFLANWYAHS